MDNLIKNFSALINENIASNAAFGVEVFGVEGQLELYAYAARQSLHGSELSKTEKAYGFNFTEHVVLNLYYGAQVVIISAFFYVILLAFGINFFTLSISITLLTFIYLFYVLKRVFNTSFWNTLGYFVLMFLMFFLIFIALMMIIGLVVAIIVLIKKIS